MSLFSFDSLFMN